MRVSGQARGQVGEIALRTPPGYAARRSALNGMSPLIPTANLRRLLGDQVVAKVRRDLNREFQLAAALGATRSDRRSRGQVFG